MSTERSGSLIDLRVARWAAAAVAPRPRTTPDDAKALRTQIAFDLPRIDAATRTWSQLAPSAPALDIRVVGRMGWVTVNLASLAAVLEPVRDRIARVPGAPQALGVQFGALFGLLSAKVLGQYVLPLAGGTTGQLVVIGPNLLDLDRTHGPLAMSMRRAVLLHEATHGLQFAHAPWLADHLRGVIHAYLEHAQVDRDTVVRVMSSLPQTVQRIRESGTIEPVLDVVLSDEQRRLLDQAQGLMSMLEGHGSLAMFDADEALLGDVDAVRTAFATRHNDVTARILRAVAALDVKRQQYAQGEAFVRAVRDTHGVDTVNLAFADAGNLPTKNEIDAPTEWAERVRAA